MPRSFLPDRQIAAVAAPKSVASASEQKTEIRDCGKRVRNAASAALPSRP